MYILLQEIKFKIADVVVKKDGITKPKLSKSLVK